MGFIGHPWQTLTPCALVISTLVELSLPGLLTMKPIDI